LTGHPLGIAYPLGPMKVVIWLLVNEEYNLIEKGLEGENRNDSEPIRFAGLVLLPFPASAPIRKASLAG
jgi:hypothetical protein